MDSELPCSLGSAIAKADMPLHTHLRSDSLKSSHDACNCCCGNKFLRKAVPRKFSKKAFLKYPENKFPSEINLLYGKRCIISLLMSCKC